MSNRIKYIGQPLNTGQEHPIESYIPSDDLKDVVNITFTLRERPLLLMGEPGCGKTKLAEAVAYEIHGQNNSYKDYFFRWDIKSTDHDN